MYRGGIEDTLLEILNGLIWPKAVRTIPNQYVITLIESYTELKN